MAEGEHGEERPANIIMAAAQGAQTGVKLAVAVGAMVLAFVALVALANGLLGGIGDHWFGQPGWSLPGGARLCLPAGHVHAERAVERSRRGRRPVRHQGGAERICRLHRAGASRGRFRPPTVAVVTFALCGFANFSSIAIQMAVTGGLAPNQRPMIAKLGLKALLAGSLSNLMSAALAGLILSAAAVPVAAPPPPPAPVTVPAAAPTPGAARVPDNQVAPTNQGTPQQSLFEQSDGLH